jgi:predicted restriction endonuclease
LKSLGDVDRTKATAEVAELVDYAGGTSATLVETRLKQSFFRRAVLSSYGGQCCITGLSVPQLLTASHIVPWAEDRRNRLNPSNGLCLSALHDRAFDQGLLTVLPDLTIKMSRRLAKSEDRFVGTALRFYDGKKIRTPEKFFPQADFLEYHNRKIFKF